MKEITVAIAGKLLTTLIQQAFIALVTLVICGTISFAVYHATFVTFVIALIAVVFTLWTSVLVARPVQQRLRRPSLENTQSSLLSESDSDRIVRIVSYTTALANISLLVGLAGTLSGFYQALKDPHSTDALASPLITTSLRDSLRFIETVVVVAFAYVILSSTLRNRSKRWRAVASTFTHRHTRTAIKVREHQPV